MENHKELLFFVKKVTITERSTEILRKFFFLTGENREQKLDLLKQIFFLIKPIKGYKYKKNFFSHQFEAHTAKLCFSVV